MANEGGESIPAESPAEGGQGDQEEADICLESILLTVWYCYCLIGVHIAHNDVSTWCKTLLFQLLLFHQNMIGPIVSLLTFTLGSVLPLIKELQSQHGLRHGDYQRYRYTTTPPEVATRYSILLSCDHQMIWSCDHQMIWSSQVIRTRSGHRTNHICSWSCVLLVMWHVLQ